MSALADIQSHVRRALLTGDAHPLAPLLVGGRDARTRLAIHQRHYAASLITALLDRFPATVWLVGSAFVTEAARHFVRHHPPTRPCIAEYGEAFPAFLAAQAGASDIPYLHQFAELEWHLGRLALAVDVPAVTLVDTSAIDAAALVGATVALQPGVHYMHADWAIDELISLYLADDAPDQFSLQPGDRWLELRGSRGELRMNRLGHAEFVFRSTLATGISLGAAAVSALDVDETLQAGHALLGIFRDGLVITIDVRHMDGAA
jgi:hypothetical protein